jgi:carbon storage regulator
MLVLSRKVGERIMIGPNVAVTVIEIQGDRVRLGFDAPHHIPIHRQEVYLRIQSEQEVGALPRDAASPFLPEFA